MWSEKLLGDGLEDRGERKGDTAGETVKLVSVKQNQMSGETTDGQHSRGSGWGVARGDKLYPILCWFPSEFPRHQDTIITNS